MHQQKAAQLDANYMEDWKESNRKVFVNPGQREKLGERFCRLMQQQLDGFSY